MRMIQVLLILALVSAAAPAVEKPRQGQAAKAPSAVKAAARVMSATEFPSGSNGYYVDKKWLAINPSKNKKAKTSKGFPFASGTYDVIFMAVGENDGNSKYNIAVNGEVIGSYSSPMTQSVAEEGPKYNAVFEGIKIGKGDEISVEATIGSADGSGHTRGRWAGLAFVAEGKGKALAGKVNSQVKVGRGPKRAAKIGKVGTTYTPTTDPKIRKADGKGEIAISGELKQWHKVTLTLDGPFAHELDEQNPFMDYRMTVNFRHESGRFDYQVPGYFAADGNAAETSADSGTAWRAHLSPDVPGKWSYKVSFVKGKGIAVSDAAGQAVPPFDGRSGTITIAKTDKGGIDLRGKGRLVYDGTRYLKLAGTGRIFYKSGADAPENLFAYADFDGPFKSDGQKDNLIKKWEPHIRDWKTGDPSWQGGKGKGLIGAINYLASEGMNSISFLPMNIAGDDRNVFPYTHYDERARIDCSRMEQWEIVLAHGTAMGMFLHFKTLEAENELLLDEGDLGPERKLYYRELIARFSHHPALNWNLGEEINQASTGQKASWAQYFRDTDPYQHHIVIHNGKPHWDLLGPKFALTGFSLQTSSPDFTQVHGRTFEYVKRSAEAGKPWAVACDEPGDASHSLLPDSDNPTHDNARKNALWGNFLAGGWGLEWYFGYKHAHSDLTCEDWRSRDKFWDQCRIALDFFNESQLPVEDMWCMDELLDGKDDYVFADPGVVYLVFLKSGANTLDLSGDKTSFKLKWLNPRSGETKDGGTVKGGGKVVLTPPGDQDWLAWLAR